MGSSNRRPPSYPLPTREISGPIREVSDAAPNGAFSYVLALPKSPAATLICTYWGSDRDRTFDVVVNGVVVATQTLECRQPGKAIEVACPLPPESLTGQQNLTVRFQGAGKGRVGGLLGLRLESTRP